MSLSSISRIDLNLLVALQVLLEERNVTRAAERLFVSQPAMSKTLQRLRALFDDPLFIRSGRELVPTIRALELEKNLPLLLTEIEAVVAERTFDPRVDAGHVHLATPEFIAVQLAPMLSWEFAGEAPNVVLTISSKLEEFREQLRSGDLDFVVAVDAKMQDEFVVTPAGGVAPAIWMRKGHPLAEEELTLKKMLDYPFVQYFLLQASERIGGTAETRFDKTIAERGLRRKKTIVTDQLMTALYALQASDCLMLSTADDLKMETSMFEIVRKPYPRDIVHDSNIPFSLFQHRRTLQSPMHGWFKKRLLTAMKRVRDNQFTSQ